MWTFHVVVWVVLLVIGYRGVMAIVLNETPPANSSPPPTAPGFPAQEASAYAMQFGQVYLNASPATASQRASDLASFQSTLGRFLANTAANLEMTYALTIVKQHRTWYVQGIAPSAQAGGQP